MTGRRKKEIPSGSGEAGAQTGLRSAFAGAGRTSVRGPVPFALRPGAAGRGDDEAVSLRGFYLRVLSRWYLIPLAVLLGALIGGGIYYCRHVVFAPAREYAAGARLYLEFSPDAAGNARDYYNAWTWKELITGDEILDFAMEELIGQGLADEGQAVSAAVAGDGSAVKKEDDELVLVPGKQTEGLLTRAEVLSAVTIRMPSDLRVMMLTATHHEQKKADAILSAMTAALSAFGETNENFREIRVLEATPALLVVTTDYTKNAVILGAVLAGLFCAAFLSLFYASDDAVYDPEMLGRRYDLPVLGVLGRDGRDGTAADASDSFARELRATCGKRFARNGREILLSGPGFSEAEASPSGKGERKEPSSGSHSIRIAVLTADSRDRGAAASVCEKLIRVLGSRFMDGACTFLPLEGMEETASCDCDFVIVGIPFGRRGSAFADHLLAFLSAQELPVAGLILTDTDLRYLKRLYRL